jgi:Translation elongation factor Ts
MNEKDIENVRKLREETGISLMSCKKAYCDNDNDYNKALEALRKDDRYNSYIKGI